MGNELDISGELEKTLIQEAINEIIGDDKKKFKELFEKVFKLIKKDKYYFLYYINERLYFCSTDMNNCLIDIKDSKGVNVTELTDYLDIVKSI